MPTLSLVRTDFGKILKWGGIIIGIIIIFFVIIRILLFVKELILPSAPPPPTVTFGVLPKPYFPEGIKKDFTYEIDTLTGELPILNLSEKVYKMEQRGPDILAVERTSEKVGNLDFNPRPQQISDFVYSWSNPNPPLQKIVINIKLSEFNLTSSFLGNADITAEKFEAKEEPINTAKGFLNTLDFYPEDIDEEKTKVEFATLNGSTITPTTRIVNSNVATVYFFQKKRDELPIVYPEGPNSSMRLMVNAGRDSTVLGGKFSYQKILDESATYPIKTAQEAYDDLKNGEGYVASHTGEDPNILIKNIYPAFYYEGRVSEYLTPVMVFEGSNNFIAYIPLVTDEWISN